jgi:sarcosine oxidase subunit gamma
MSCLALEIRSWLPEHHNAQPTVTFLGHQLPREVGASVPGSIRILCLAPAEWLLVSDELSASSIMERGAADLAGQSAIVVDASDGMGALSIRGLMARDVLSKGCGLDLRPNVFPIGRCARTRFAQMPMIIDHIDDPVGFRLYVARSYLRYLTVWVEDASAEFRNEPL